MAIRRAVPDAWWRAPLFRGKDAEPAAVEKKKRVHFSDEETEGQGAPPFAGVSQCDLM